MKKTISIIGTLAVLMFAVGLVAQSAVPGDMLYGYKTGINEKVKSWFVISYTAQVEHEVDLLEERLEEIDTLVAEGKLSPEAASIAKEKLLIQLEKTNALIGEADGRGLSTAEKREIAIQLERIKQSLIARKEALELVETEVAKKPELSRGGRSTRSVVTQAAVIADIVENVADDLDVEISDESFDDSEDTVATSTDDVSDETEAEDTATSTDEEVTQTDEPTDDSTEETEVSDSDESTTTDEVLDASVETETEAEAEAEVQS